ncbi:hypothetical protein BMS3Bbin12_01918 [bacterium BMS3Bbin12]|nr:hypothetical protein BMS3Abin12_01689 [bacterium BMS3Abin12]GBE48734.1 hypothetical protein BMS3Bbin12_01918 [bacterium BMS3Bbin12]GBE50967.1 hypothetical protein BMS3Bbin13_01920 [bacterium BMS3Bbin13]
MPAVRTPLCRYDTSFAFARNARGRGVVEVDGRSFHAGPKAPRAMAPFAGRYRDCAGCVL